MAKPDLNFLLESVGIQGTHLHLSYKAVTKDQRWVLQRLSGEYELYTWALIQPDTMEINIQGRWG